MPHLRFFSPNPLTPHITIQLSKEESHHLLKVMRVKDLAEIEIINGQGLLAKGTLSTTQNTVSVEILSVTQESDLPYFISLYQAMPKFTHLQWIIEKCCEIGVHEICLFESEKSEKTTLTHNQKNRIEHLLIASLKQCGRLSFPAIKEVDFDDIQGTQLFFGDLDSQTPLSVASSDSAFINGPEAGFTPKEIACLKEKGAIGVCLSPYTLRTETAAVVATAKLAENFLN